MDYLAFAFGLIAVGALVIEFRESKTGMQRWRVFLIALSTVGLSVITLISQNKSNAANIELLNAQAERHREILGGNVPPIVELTAWTRQETPLNTSPLYYNSDSIEYSVDLDITFYNDTKYYIKDLQCVVTYPNDYLNRKLGKYKGNFTEDMFQDYYRIIESKTIDLRVLPPGIRKRAIKIPLPTINKKFEIILDVIWTNGYYRGTYVFVKDSTAELQPQLETNYRLTFQKKPTYLMTDSTLREPRHRLTLMISPPDTVDTKIKIMKQN